MDRTWPSEWIAEAKLTGKVWGEEPEPAPFGCPNCGGRGFLVAFFVEGGPFHTIPHTAFRFVEGEGYYTGHHKTHPCPACAGHMQEQFLAKLCGLRNGELDVRLEQFKPLPGKEKAREIAVALLALTPNPKGYVTFWSDGFGRGKTLLLAGLVNGFRVAGVPSVYISLADLLDSVRDKFDEPHRAATALLEEYQAVKVMAIDEVDKVNVTPWAAETIYRLMDGRYRQRQRQLTLLAMNCSPQRLAEKDERLGYLSSRMDGGIVCEVGGQDMRLNQGQRAERELLRQAQMVEG